MGEPQLLSLNLNQFLQNSQLIFRQIQTFFNGCFQRKIKPVRRVSILALNEVDALCSTFMLQDYLTSSLNFECDFSVVRCYSELLVVYKTLRRLKPQVVCYIFINIGNRQNLFRFLPHERELVQWIILDHHRPVCHSYLVDVAELMSHSQTQMNCTTFLPAEEMEKLESAVANATEGEFVTQEEPRLEGSPRRGILRTVVATDGGEYFSAPTAILIYRALRDLDCLSIKSILCAGVSLGYHLLNYSIAQEDYNLFMRDLNKDLKELKRRYWRYSLEVHKMGFEDREIALPLLRFTSLHESIQMSPLFIACRVMEHGGSREADIELGGFRLELELDKAVWKEQTNPKLLKALRLKLPETLKKFCGTRKVPSVESEVTSPVFFISLKEKSLPDKLTTIDMAMILGHYVCNDEFGTIDLWLRCVYLNRVFQQGLRIIEWLVVDAQLNASHLILSLVAHAFAANKLIERTVTRLLSRRASAVRRAADDIGGQRGVLEGFLEEGCPVQSYFSFRRICGSLSLAGAHQHQRPQIILVATPPLGSEHPSHIIGFRDRCEHLVTNQLGFIISKFAKSVCGIEKLKQDFADSTYLELESPSDARTIFTHLFPRRRRVQHPAPQSPAAMPSEVAEISRTNSTAEAVSLEDLLYNDRGDAPSRKRPSPPSSEASDTPAVPLKKKRLDNTAQ